MVFGYGLPEGGWEVRGNFELTDHIKFCQHIKFTNSYLFLEITVTRIERTSCSEQ